MFTRSTLVVSVVLFVASAASAGATDVNGNYAGSIKDPAIEGVPVPAAVYIEERARWYLRGDIGYGLNLDPTVSYADIFRPQSHGLGGLDYDDSSTIGGGFGLYISPNLRADFTFDHRSEATVTGSVADQHTLFDDGDLDPTTNPNGIYDDGPTGTVVGGGSIYVEDAAGNPRRTHIAGTYEFGISTNVFLANLYYDFRAREGFTPYVGAGLGIAHHEIGGGTVVDVNGDVGTIGSDSQTNFAFAAMVGFSYNLGRGYMLDAGYRFLWMGDAQTGVTTVNNTAGPVVNPDVLNVNPIIEDLISHEFRIGIRYEIW